MTFDESDSLISLFSNVMGRQLGDDEMSKVRGKFQNHVTKYKGDYIQFFKDEIENFNYIGTKMLKKIGKLYAMAKDDQPVSESIINWELHQELMDKKYGKRRIDTEFKFKM
jgi:hypothetical protein